MDVYHTIVRPIVTEKSTHQTTTKGAGRGGAYTFEVHADATKPQVREAVEKIYGVKVVDVRTAVRPGKSRRFRFRFGTTSAVKRAIVVLDPQSHIDLF